MSGRTPVVVVVEDDASMSRAIERILNAGGLRAVTYSTAEAALDANPESADCLVVDIQLPGLSGFELYDRLAACDDRPPAIFITAHDVPTARDTADRLGAAAFLPKPFSGRALLDAVTRAMNPN